MIIASVRELMTFGLADPTEKKTTFYVERGTDNPTPISAYSLYRMTVRETFEISRWVENEEIVLRDRESNTETAYEYLGDASEVDWEQYEMEWEEHGGKPEWVT